MMFMLMLVHGGYDYNIDFVENDNFYDGGNAPINSKLQHPPPRANPGHLNF